MVAAVGKRHQIAKLLAILGAMFVLVHWAESGDFLSALTRPAVVGLLNATGVGASDNGTALLVGRVDVPWTRDCSGLNILAVLLALTLWTNRHQSSWVRYCLRLVIAVAAGFVANIVRILVLIGYRWVVWPEVESPQLHYFIGFLCVIPFLPLVAPRGNRPRKVYLLEALYMVVVLALLAPFVASPGGEIVALATLVMLASSRPQVPTGRVFLAMSGIWLAAGIFIGGVSMESLWTPWLLLCPLFVSRPLLFSAAGPVLVAGSIPLVAMQPLTTWLVLAAALWWGVKMLKGRTTPVPVEQSCGGITATGFALALLLPFIASVTSVLRYEHLVPPPGVMAQSFELNGYRLRLVGQSPDIDMLWYGPYGDGRHHTLRVCMLFRGIEVEADTEWPDLHTDGHVWLKEYFIQENRLLGGYPDYVWRTTFPFSSAGVHLIASAPRSLVSAESFVRDADDLARRIHQLVLTEKR